VPVRAEIQARASYLGRVVKTGLRPLWATIGAVVVLLACVIFEGSFRMNRQLAKTHAAEIAAERAKHASSPGMSPQRKAAILAGAHESAVAQRKEALRRLRGEGRVLQARLGEWGTAALIVPTDLNVDIARWEADAETALQHRPERLAEFRGVRRDDAFTVTTGSAHGRIERLLEILDAASTT